MLKECRDELICDFAEEYHILDFYQLPAQLAAALAVGLRANSRVKMKMSGIELPMDILLMAGISDKLSILNWHISGNPGSAPKLILPALLNNDETEKTVLSMKSGEDFDTAWKRVTRRT